MISNSVAARQRAARNKNRLRGTSGTLAGSTSSHSSSLASSSTTGSSGEGTGRNRLSFISTLYDRGKKGYLTQLEQTVRDLDRDGIGAVPPAAVLGMVEEHERVKRRQWLLILGNIVQWLPLIIGAAITLVKFGERQYQQNVGGRVITRTDYLKKNVVTGSEIDGLWKLSGGMAYPLTEKMIDDYDRDGFVVLPNFLTKEEAASLDKILSYNLDEMAFPDILTACSRKLHGEHYHSTVTWRFWQQPRISDMLSKLALGGETPYMVTSEILEMPNGASCIPQWHWDFLTFPQTFNASYHTGTQIWLSTEAVDANTGGGMAFMPGSHKWANSVDDGAAQHECFAMNLFEELSDECRVLLDSHMVVPTLNPGDIIVFSRFTLHRSVPRNQATPFISGARKGYTLRIGSAKSVFKRDTMSCFPSHPSSNFQGQLHDGERYDVILDKETKLPRNEAIYRPMNLMDSEDLIVGHERGRAMSISDFLLYSTRSVFRQKIKWKLAKVVEDTVNGLTCRHILDISCKASPTPDFR